MKKFLFVFILSAALVIAGSYLFIPPVASTNASITFRGNSTVTNRVLGLATAWNSAVVHSKTGSGTAFKRDGYEFRVLNTLVGQVWWASRSVKPI